MTEGLAAKYRMPRWFGPLPGPRNVPADRLPAAGNVDVTALAVTARSDRAAIQALLPPRCTVWGEPTITVTVSFLRNIGWLAGRGYNIVAVSVPVEFAGEEGVRRGPFLPVLWESHADPIITGRDELGFAKLYAAIDGPGPAADHMDAAARWEGFRFFDLQIWDIAQGTPAPPALPGTDGSLHYKFVPRCGDQGKADVEYMVLVPHPEPPGPGEGSFTVQQRGGRGKFAFHPARWEDMPTQYPIVNALAALPLIEFLGAQVTISAMRASSTRALDGARPLR